MNNMGYGASFKELKLTRGKVALVDACDFARVVEFKWQAFQTKNGVWYAKRGVRYTTEMLHRFIMNDGRLYDHIDGDGLNNQRSNLRHCTVSQNGGNQKLMSSNTSGFKGVTRFRGKWRAHIGARSAWLGDFEDKKDAAMAYDSAAIIIYGEFAKTNKMMGLL